MKNKKKEAIWKILKGNAIINDLFTCCLSFVDQFVYLNVYLNVSVRIKRKTCEIKDLCVTRFFFRKLYV